MLNLGWVSRIDLKQSAESEWRCGRGKVDHRFGSCTSTGIRQWEFSQEASTKSLLHMLQCPDTELYRSTKVGVPELELFCVPQQRSKADPRAFLLAWFQ